MSGNAENPDEYRRILLELEIVRQNSASIPSAVPIEIDGTNYAIQAAVDRRDRNSYGLKYPVIGVYSYAGREFNSRPVVEYLS